MRTGNAAASTQSGFSLIELLVAMLIAVEILVAGAIAFDLNNRMAQVQTQLTDLQQSLRIAQTDIARQVRIAGRGGLPAELAPGAVYDPSDPIPSLNGLAIEVRDNVDSSNHAISRGTGVTSPEAVDGTDILTLRGCFSTALYQVEPSTFTKRDSDGDSIIDEGTLPIQNTSVAGVLQDLQPLVDEINAYGVGATARGKMILVSPEARSIYGIADIKSVDATNLPTSVTLTLNLVTNSPLNPVDPDDLVREFPPNMLPVFGCFLEEYRYYVHEEAGDTLTPVLPRLTRARFEPGTEQAYLGNSANFELDLADGVFDLQVALGLDTDYPSVDPAAPASFGDDSDNLGNDDVIVEAAAGDPERAHDDWLFNDATDLATDTQYTVHSAAGTQADVPVQLYFVRISTWGRTRRADPKYQAPTWTALEDEALNPTYWSGNAFQFRKRALTTIIDMRNI